MKRNIYILSLIMLIIPSACEYVALDRELPTSISGEQVFENFNYNSRRVNNIYSYLPEGFLNIDGAMMASACDEAEHTLETSAIQKFNEGAWNELDNPDNVWNNYYKGIRAANLFLATSDNINLDEYRLDPDEQTHYQNLLVEINRWKYEVRFLRAFFYFELVKRYGGVPLVTEALTTDDFQEIPRSSLASCIQFITTECDAAANVLPEIYSDASVDMGRATKGAALALKSRVLLYTASDLFNNTSWASGYSKTELISMTGDRQSKWQAAAAAAKAVIDLSGAGYALSADFAGLFMTYNDPEIIFAHRSGSSNTFEQASFPIGYNLGQSGTTPSQNLVDAFEMSDGTKFDWTNPVHAASPFSNRDPRLTYSILTNNTLFKDRPVECWTGGLDGKGTTLATKTGYYLKKYVNENLNLLQGRTSVHSWIIFRLAEIYLNYAEALNESNPGDPDIKIYVDMVRARSGVDMPPLPSGLSQSEMRERIRNERRVELAFEDHRFWDVRRWMEAPEHLGVPIEGLEITKIDDSTFNYQKINVENRVFESKMYLYPIPQSELFIMGWDQNPLW